MNFNECPRLVRKSSRRKLAGDLVTTLTKLSTREKTKKTSNLSLSPSPDQARHPAPCPRVGSPLEVEENLKPVGASNAEVDLTVKKVELSISTLERTIRNTE